MPPMPPPPRTWNVYLSGEIHSDWRDVVACGVAHLPITCTGPNNSHEDSDDCGAVILGMQAERANWDAHSARINLLRTKTLLGEADVVVVRFGTKFRQWNAAFEAGQAAALGTPLIVVHPPELSHMLKEVNAGALAVCEHPEQVAHILEYTLTGALPPPLDGEELYVPIAERLGKGNPNP